jgi:hypothetical protein
MSVGPGNLRCMSRNEEKSRQWQSLVAKFEQAGASQAEFVAAAGVSLPAFRYWLYKIRAATGGRAAAAPARSRIASDGGEVRLLPVELRRGPRVEAAVVEIDVATLRLRISAGTDPRYVASLVGALREVEC